MKIVDPAVPIPEMFKGRKVTSRGVHMHPNGQWGAFMDSADEWIQRLLDMHITWVVALTDSDSILLSGAADALLSAGIIPIVRDNPSNLPAHFTNHRVVEQLVDLYSRHGAPLFYAYLNECKDPREWQGGDVPGDWWNIWTTRWREAASVIADRGAIVCLPDGPAWEVSPFPDCSRGIEYLFEDGWVAYKYHGYALNRPLDWPYDDAQRFGVPMTEAEYREALDDFYDVPYWQDPPLDVLNSERQRLANPSLTAVDDPVCWMGWQLVEHRMIEDLGFLIPMFMGEGGVTPKARAGSGSNNELRYVLPTPKVVAQRTVEMFSWNSLPDRPAKHHMFAMCPWVLASDALGATGWYDDVWFGGGYTDMYGFAKPVVQALIDNPPDGEPATDISRAIQRLRNALDDTSSMVQSLMST